MYCQVLKGDLLESLGNLEINKHSIYFQYDNDPKHIADKTRLWLANKKINVLEWPAYSPNINIIEHTQDCLDHRVCTCNMLPSNEQEL